MEQVEGETLDAVIHQDAEIVSQKPARDTKRKARSHDEGLPEGEEDDGQEGIERGGEEAYMRLFLESIEVSVERAAGERTQVGSMSRESNWKRIGE